MGDRGNIVIETVDEKLLLAFYTHWSGSGLPAIVAKGLDNGRSRWGDDAYLNRILFQTLLDGDTASTGFGIDTHVGDNENPLVFISHDNRRVRYENSVFSFEGFVAKFREVEAK